ncbi:MAG TPA: helix-turn-helix domain-containing protein [Nitrososphaeraceae archaeon]|nr:helix-turn-helix domain-containing protein [Nitrososphaeraceae archaeon]
MSTQVEHQQIEWRRAKVLELSSQGHTQREIADNLHIGIGTVNRDLAYLSKQAQEELKTHIQERLPEQYQKCMTGLNQVIKMGWNIANSDSSSAANRLQALALINDSYKYVMDLTTNGVVITGAIKFVQTTKENLMSSKEEDGKESKEPDYDEDKDQLEEEQEKETGEIDQRETTN